CAKHEFGNGFDYW
nr:immunoglobulin heavy chain junction region [Macaca mulatta]MOV42030.1 immunoglobulin heavy chain junction region [Macaca mulatta]MOV43415.1 immunoglobulin heavy chain junction region [Macaca mulatta]MOV45294.1 immunoglobulin heavy chain junction region [Macaca mulatta]